jgi:hypothetical protein
MVSVKVVTGYIPIANHPRTPQEYGALGEQLKQLKAPVQPHYGVVTSTWLYQMIAALPFEPVWAVSDNPHKNTLAYHCVQHQKFQWLYDAMKMDAAPDVFVWLDYGICHVPGVTPAVINDFLDRVKKRRLLIPGCTPIQQIDDEHPCWRFCGGVMVVPRKYVQDLKNLMQAITMLHLNVTKKVTFEVNTLARAEQAGKVPIEWYAADHNETMFTGYP